jgi:hypothetical protein
MSRGGSQKADTLFNQSQNQYNTANANASSLFQTLNPICSQEATNPTGFSDSDMSAMNTAGQQSTGGAVAAAKGELGLRAARTGNRGGTETALDSSVRNAMQTNSQNALKVQSENAMLKQANQQAGISGLQGLYGQNVNDTMASLGLGNSAVQTGVQAGRSGWFQNFTDYINAVAGNLKSASGGG